MICFKNCDRCFVYNLFLTELWWLSSLACQSIASSNAQVEGSKHGVFINVYIEKIFSSAEALCQEQWFYAECNRFESRNLDFW